MQFPRKFPVPQREGSSEFLQIHTLLVNSIHQTAGVNKQLTSFINRSVPCRGSDTVLMKSTELATSLLHPVPYNGEI